MKTRYLICAAMAAAFMSSTALAQTAAPPAKAPAPAATETAPKLQSPHWRASKLIGVKIYNDQNERLGDINEIILDQNGKVQGFVVGVGGFLGMGEHDIFIEPGKIKFVNEPVRTTTTAPATGNPPAGAPTTTRNVSNTGGTARADIWYPDHGILSANKDQLKAMPQFKYSSYN